MNPFPNPTTISLEINQEITALIKKEFEINKKLEFHAMLKFLENAVSEKDMKKSLICAFYAANVTINTGHLTDIQKEQVISGLYDTINDLEYELGKKTSKNQHTSDTSSTGDFVDSDEQFWKDTSS